MDQIYPIPPFRPYFKYKQLDSGIYSFKIGVSDDGLFYVDEYDSGDWINTYSTKIP